MKKRYYYLLLVSCILLLTQLLHAQRDGSLPAKDFSAQSLRQLEKKYTRPGNLLQKQSEHFLERMRRKEAWLQKKLEGKDSVAARQMLRTPQYPVGIIITNSSFYC